MGSGAVISGSVACFTADAALALGDPEAALADLAIATEMEERIGVRPWLAQARQGHQPGLTNCAKPQPSRR